MLSNFKLLIKSFIILMCLFNCLLASKNKSNNQIGTNNNIYKDIVGCWSAKPEGNFSDRNEELRLISLKPDGIPAITLVYELGPRCRIWEYDINVTYQNGTVSWKAHKGQLNENKDTMMVIKEWKGDKTTWILTCQNENDDMMQKLVSSIGKEYNYNVPEFLTDGWDCADISEVGIDKEKIVQFMHRIAGGKHDDIHSILIVKNGKLVLEEYFATRGKRFGSFITHLLRERPHHLASTTKGVLSALTGIALDKGCIKDVDEPIYKYMPEYASSFTEEKKQIKVKDLLTMTAGWEWEQFKYKWNDPKNNAAEMWNCNDVIKYVLEKPLVSKPGDKFEYSNGAPTVMGLVLKNSCGIEVNKFAEQYLFQPLGISDYLWTSYFDGSIETDGGLALRSRDLAKIGQLFLNNGKWQGNQIISENWIKESTKSRIKLRGFWGWQYGYYWMQVDLKLKNKTFHSFFVPGDGGQLLSVFPDLNMVIVFTAGNYGTNVKSVCFNMISQYILTAVLSLSER